MNCTFSTFVAPLKVLANVKLLVSNPVSSFIFYRLYILDVIDIVEVAKVSNPEHFVKFVITLPLLLSNAYVPEPFDGPETIVVRCNRKGIKICDYLVGETLFTRRKVLQDEFNIFWRKL